MQDDVRTLLRQAQAFLGQRDAIEAIRLLEQAQTLARDDREAKAKISIEQAAAHEILGNSRRVLQLAKQAMLLDNGLRGRVEALAKTCDEHGNQVLARDLKAIVPPADTRHPRRGKRQRLVVVGSLVGFIVCASAMLYLFDGSTGLFLEKRQRLDIDRIKENVGLVVVEADYLLRNSINYRRIIATGSCFAVSPDGLLVTNKHVTRARELAEDTLRDGADPLAVRQSLDISVCFGPDKKDHLRARILYESPYVDVALLKVERTFPRYLRLVAHYQAGDEVYATGFPGRSREVSQALADPAGLWQQFVEQLKQGKVDESPLNFTPADYDVTVTKGVISVRRSLDGAEWIQHDAVISGGSSGGPLITPACRVIGINTRRHAESEGFNVAIGLERLRAELAPFVKL